MKYMNVNSLNMKKCASCGCESVTCARLEPHFIPFSYSGSLEDRFNHDRQHTSVGTSTVVARCRTCGVVGDETGWKTSDPDWESPEVPYLIAIPAPKPNALKCGHCGGPVIWQTRYEGYNDYIVDEDGMKTLIQTTGIVQPAGAGDLVCTECGWKNAFVGLSAHDTGDKLTVTKVDPETWEAVLDGLREREPLFWQGLVDSVGELSFYKHFGAKAALTDVADKPESPDDHERCPQCGWPNCGGDQAYCPACGMDDGDTSW